MRNDAFLSKVVFFRYLLVINHLGKFGYNRLNHVDSCWMGDSVHAAFNGSFSMKNHKDRGNAECTSTCPRRTRVPAR